MKQTPALQNAQRTILVVDDDANILKSISDFLVSSNYNVLRASSGKKALQQSKDYKPEIHLLLSDFQMPGMSGIDLAAQITMDRPQLKVLMMSGFSGGMPALNAGWRFIAKPFLPSQLRVLILGLTRPTSE